MKKIISLLILSMFFGLFYKPMTSSANEVLDKGVKVIEPYGRFNYFRGVSKTEYEESEVIDVFYSYFESMLENGTLENVVKVKNTAQTEYNFKFNYEYVDYSLTDAKVYFNSTLIYHALFDGEFITEVKVCEKFIVEEHTKIKNDYFVVSSYGLLQGSEDCEYELEDMEDIGMFLIQGHRYIYNEEYADNDVYFVTSIDNLISFNDIKSKLTASDPTDGDLTSKIEVYNNTYNPNDANITIGEYKFDAVVYDTVGNTTYQTCYVKVVDLIPPVITVAEPMEVTYAVQYPLSTLIKKFTATDNVEVESLEITSDTYSSNYNVPGTYYVTATATDTSGNTASATLTIKVVDKVAPKIEGPYRIITTTLNPYTKEQLRNQFTFSDVIDTNVTRYEITDNNGYFNNTKVAGEYKFRITAYDNSNNAGVKDFVLIVKDLDYPSISIDSNYTITVDSGERLTKEQIVEFLNASGVTSISVVDVESECFDDENPSGVYDASIVLEDGTVIKNKLVFNEPIDYNPPIVEAQDYTVVAICGILCLILFIVAIYFRRVRRLQNRR